MVNLGIEPKTSSIAVTLWTTRLTPVSLVIQSATSQLFTNLHYEYNKVKVKVKVKSFISIRPLKGTFERQLHNNSESSCPFQRVASYGEERARNSIHTLFKKFKYLNLSTIFKYLFTPFKNYVTNICYILLWYYISLIKTHATSKC